MKILFSAFLILIGSLAYSQSSNIEKYHRAKIYYKSAEDLNRLKNIGIPLDHGIQKKDRYVESDFSQSQIESAQNNGNEVTIIINDVQQFYKDQNNPQSARYVTKNEECASNDTMPNYQTPINYNNGSMGGYLTYSQMLQELDDMKSLYPNLISSRANISTFTTQEGRTIQYLKISDNADSDESSSESQILYTAIHHAREPLSLQQTIFYMWYLLENYNTNDKIKKIIDNTELFFVPCINPDGYIYNETTNPNGGGLWRKNRRDNGDGTFGVDCNRNYSYVLANGTETWNTAGTSPNTNGDTYAGPSPFSEPENQAIRWLVENNNFKISVNGHSFGKLLLFPFAYTDNTFTPDHETFDAISEYMVNENNYDNIITSDFTTAAGGSDDFMYDMLTTVNGGNREKVFAMTPEIGDSFWPAQSTIIEHCKNMLALNISAAEASGNLAKAKDKNPEIFISTSNYNPEIEYEIERIGLIGSGNFTVSINPVSSNILSVSAPQPQNSMSLLEKRVGTFTININSNTNTGEDIVYEIVINNGLFDTQTTVSKKFGDIVTIINETGDDISTYWNTSNTKWGVDTTQFFSPPSSISDSPSGSYDPNENNVIQLKNDLDLTSATYAKLSFYAYWLLHGTEDFVQIEVSNDGGNTWIPQCGKQTSIGTNNEQVYEGFQTDWVFEELFLDDYLGEVISIRFQLISNANINLSGFYFDDLKLDVIEGNTLSNTNYDYITNNFNIYPNPVNNEIQISSLLPNYKYQIYNIQGQLIQQQEKQNKLSTVDCSNFQSGMYLLKISKENETKTFKFVKN